MSNGSRPAQDLRAVRPGALALVLGSPAGAAPVLIEATSMSSCATTRRRRSTHGSGASSFRSTTSRATGAEPDDVSPVPGGPDDPTVAGATLYVANAAGSGETVRVELPAAGWQLQGTAQRPRGFVFRDRAPGAPVGQVTIAADRITVRLNGAGWPYTLDEAQQTRVALRLDLGAAAWCTDAPARASGNPPSTAANDQPGRFTAQSKVPPPAACALNRLEVGNGYGSGTYPAGSTVHVSAAVRPLDQLVTGWTGDAALLADPGEWNTTLVMPARDVVVAATVADRPIVLRVEHPSPASRRTSKAVPSRIPASPRGLVLFLHGTGGGNSFITHEETAYVALRALESGYGVLGHRGGGGRRGRPERRRQGAPGTRRPVGRQRRPRQPERADRRRRAAAAASGQHAAATWSGCRQRLMAITLGAVGARRSRRRPRAALRRGGGRPLRRRARRGGGDDADADLVADVRERRQRRGEQRRRGGEQRLARGAQRTDLVRRAPGDGAIRRALPARAGRRLASRGRSPRICGPPASSAPTASPRRPTRSWRR